MIDEEDLDYWFIDDGNISTSFVPPAYESMDVDTARQVRDELTVAIERVECDHDFDQWTEVGSGPIESEKMYTSECEKCDKLEIEWRKVDEKDENGV